MLRTNGALAVWWGHGHLVDPDAMRALAEISERWAPGFEARRRQGGGGPGRRHELGAAPTDHPAFGPLELGAPTRSS